MGTGVEVEKVVGANSDDGVGLQSSPKQVVTVAVEVMSQSSPEQEVGDGAGGVVGSALVVSGAVVSDLVVSGTVVSGLVVSGTVLSGVVGSGLVGSGLVGSGLVGSGFTGVVVLSVKDSDFSDVGSTGVVFVVSLDVTHEVVGSTGVFCVVGFTGVVSGSEVVDFEVLVLQGVVCVAVSSVDSVTVVGFTGVGDVVSHVSGLVKDVDKTDELGDVGEDTGKVLSVDDSADVVSDVDSVEVGMDLDVVDSS